MDPITALLAAEKEGEKIIREHEKRKEKAIEASQKECIRIETIAKHEADKAIEYLKQDIAKEEQKLDTSAKQEREKEIKTITDKADKNMQKAAETCTKLFLELNHAA